MTVLPIHSSEGVKDGRVPYSIATIVAIYSILTLALNIRWGFTGLLDFGIAGFFAIGAYTSAILTSPPSEELVFGVRHSLGFGVPFLGGS